MLISIILGFLCNFALILKPKVLHINTTSNAGGGAARIVSALHSGSAEWGMESFLAVGYGKSHQKVHVMESVWRYRINAFQARLWADDGFLNRRATRRMLDFINGVNPDIIHLHNLHGYYLDIETLCRFLETANKPVVITMHDLWLTTGRCAHPPGGSCAMIEQRCHPCPHKGRYPAKWIGGRSHLHAKQRLLKKASAVVVPSEWMAARIQGATPIIIPNGIDGNAFRERANHRQKGTLIAVANRWTPEKGFYDLIRLADALPQGWTINMAGENVPRHKSITNLGRIDSPEDLGEKLSESTALLSASLEESFGLTVAESLATGTPAIVRQGTAAADLIVDKTFAVDFSNPQKVIEALNKLNQYVFPEKVVDIHEMCSQYHHLYRSLLNP